jgi:hypothetical protein
MKSCDIFGIGKLLAGSAYAKFTISFAMFAGIIAARLDWPPSLTAAV